ncbi:MAG: hypothetical protein JSS14_21495 [Proteobacteria bacterium]|nr:hypothetical protein [Pseudomonadota bacterium]
MESPEGKATESAAQAGRTGMGAVSWLFAIAALVVIAGIFWAGDQITLQNERTIFTADCQGGAWQGADCKGKLVAGPRYRFRALRPHGEVLFWTVGNTGPSGRLAPCTITDGRNWTCQPCPDAARTITLQMASGRPVVRADGSSPTLPFHAVPKWRWWLLRASHSSGGGAPAN